MDFRNALVHRYFGINYTLVWSIINDELPLLSEKLKPVILTELYENKIGDKSK